MNQPVIMTVRVVGGDQQEVVTALRRAGLLVELQLLGAADTAWSIRVEKPDQAAEYPCPACGCPSNEPHRVLCKGPRPMGDECESGA